MADLNPGDFHVDAPLTGLVVGYRPMGMIADQIFPVRTVSKKSDLYWVINKADWFRPANTLRAPGQPPREIRFTVSSGAYNVENHELGAIVPWETIDNADNPLEPLQLQTQQIIDVFGIGFEERVVAALVSGVGSSMTRSAGDAWSDPINSSPLDDADVAREAIRSGTGKVPNTMVIGEKTFLKLRRHPDLVRAAYPGAGVGGVVTEQQMAGLFNVDRLLIGRSIKNTAVDDVAGTSTFTDVWSTHAFFLHTEPNPGFMSATFGLSFRWTGPNIGASGPIAPSVMRRENAKIKSTELQAGYYQTEKIIAPELGFQIKTGIV